MSIERLREVIHKCSEYYSVGDDGEKLRTIRDAADNYLSGSIKVPVLKISDYNTTGLRGVKEETGSNWTGLVRERSATNKSNTSSGAFGVGKFAPYNFITYPLNNLLEIALITSGNVKPEKPGENFNFNRFGIFNKTII